MSSRPLSTQKGSIVEMENQNFQPIWKNSNFPQKNISVNTQKSIFNSNNPIQIRGPKPFYRSRVTPDPFDYSNETRRQNEIPDRVSRRFSFSQNNGKSSSNSYESDQDATAINIGRQMPYLSNSYRSVTPTPRSTVSVSSSQSPMIKISRRPSSPNRSEIHISPSQNVKKSVARTISVTRPESPSVSMQRTGAYQPNGHDKRVLISLGNPQNSREPSFPATQSLGRTSPLIRPMDFQRENLDNRSTSNVVTNRFKPLLAFTGPSAILDNTSNRYPQGMLNLPPSSPTASLNSSNGRHLNGNRSDVGHLKNLLMKTIHRPSSGNFFGMCGRCHDEILGEENGLVAMDRMYHVACFTCIMCGGRLRGMHFYSMENQPYCEPCYVNSLEKCVVCAQPIIDRVLRATGKAYHPQCFCCAVCRKSLDGVPFTIDIRMDVHCVDCFHQKFAPRCCSCHLPILPSAGQDQTVRIVACDRNYHLECYRCENCQIQLNNEQGCYPIDEHIFCSNCHLFYAKTRLTYS